MVKSKHLKNLLLSLLRKTDEKLIRDGLRILDSILRSGYEPDQSFEQVMLSLSSSPNYEIRQRSIGIIKAAFPHLTPATIERKPPNPLFDLTLVTPRGLVDLRKDEELLPYDTVKDTTDPMEFVQPFIYWVEVLSEHTDIPEINLATRMQQIVSEIESPEKVTGAYEYKLRQHLNTVDLEYPMKRPRHSLIQKALLHLVTELIDAEVIGSEDEILKKFDFYDPSIPFIFPISRPEYVKLMLNGKDSSYGLNSKWATTIREADIIHPARLDDSSVILAEYTLNRNHGWGYPTEIFMRQLLIEGNLLPIIHDNIFAKILHCMVAEYSEEETIRSPYLIVTNHFSSGSGDSDRCHWLALNPGFAHMMNWIYSPEGLFRWLDKNDNLMVESIYWEDGNIWTPQPNYDCTTGVGWVVKASQAAMDQIQAKGYELYYQSQITRSMSEGKVPYKHTEIFNNSFR